MKRCPSCGVCKPLDQFSPGARDPARQGVRGYCKPCKAAYNRGKYRDGAYRQYMREYHFRYKYGLTPECLAEIRAEQADRCAICRLPLGSSHSTHVDHNHETGAVRGILCSTCNTGLGKFRDDPELLRAAAHYLETASATSSCSPTVSD